MWKVAFVLISAFCLSAVAGVASLLRSPNTISRRTIISSVLNSGLLGLGIGLVWLLTFRENPYALVGTCLLFGLGGYTAVDFVLGLLQKGGFTIKLGSNGIKIQEGSKDE